ncbi:patatin-like phospholipase family protein [Paracoccus sp. S-4012]|uniref:patatin-like phospholipase family protein n=1 Tax=Paracoccus sp. S-4012 TaxID=2665648 RepID=UPI0012AFC4CB|nr:patatin-like phospholipase family protein [Paracoccus sp. S-4012]MRX51335.1 patatin-like phospholipase family protein [Paracoccus sp. S-4012]
MTEHSSSERWVCLAGGNALGAFHLGAIEALLDARVPVRRVAGASIGAVVAALWLGGPPDGAAGRLRAFWTRAEGTSASGGLRFSRQMAAIRALLGGRPRLFLPTLPGLWAAHPLASDDDHLHSTAPLRRTLLELIDFDRLNDGQTRLIVNALDQRTAEDVVFDTAETRLTVDHLLASTALPLLFPPVEIEGRLLVDPGLSANLPIAALFRDRPRHDVLCWAIDLWPRAADRATSPDTVTRRAQDLLFAAQSRHALEHLTETASAPLRERELSVAVHHLGYDGGDWEVAAKAFDFSHAAIMRRRRAGTAVMCKALSDAQPSPQPGLSVIRHGFCS